MLMGCYHVPRVLASRRAPAGRRMMARRARLQFDFFLFGGGDSVGGKRWPGLLRRPHAKILCSVKGGGT